MDAQTKRTLLATLLCFVVLFGWIKLQGILYPSPPPTAPSTQPAPEGEAPGEPRARQGEAPAEPSTTQSSRPSKETVLSSVEPSTRLAQPPSEPTTEFSALGAAEARTETLGDDRQDLPRADSANPYEFGAVVTSRGAGVESVKLSRYRNHVAKDKREPDHDPYDLLRVVHDSVTDKNYASFVTEWVRLVYEDKAKKKQTYTVPLSDVNWAVENRAEQGGDAVTLRTVIKRGQTDVLAVRKTYSLDKGSHDLQIKLDFENLSDQPFDVIVAERGPVGIKKEDPRWEYRRVVATVIDDSGLITIGDTTVAKDKHFQGGENEYELRTDEKHPLWAEVGNKYFACIMAPLPQPTPQAPTAYPSSLLKASAKILVNHGEQSDAFTVEQQFRTGKAIDPGQHWQIEIEAYCGPKSKSLFDSLPDAVARHYLLASNPDHSGCTFEVLTRAMLWLLTTAHRLVGNYGIAIFILVVIVRLILHPITKYGQVNMMKTQKGMAKLKPKMDALQQQYKNDKQKLNEEMMKLYKEEGVSPASGLLGCLPMALQMPVWVALWTTLNTNVDMRHQPFFWWMNDLSSPDTLIPLPPAWHFNIPLIGGMIGPIEAFNLLPIIMTITMYLQQKFTQKLTKPTTPIPPQRDKDGNVLPDQMAQQQKMMNFMMIFFGLMFYNFPSGLNLYILSSNLLGMGEQYLIKKHIREKEARAGTEFKQRTPARPSAPSFLARLQKRVEQARQVQSSRDPAGRKGRRK